MCLWEHQRHQLQELAPIVSLESSCWLCCGVHVEWGQFWRWLSGRIGATNCTVGLEAWHGELPAARKGFSDNLFWRYHSISYFGPRRNYLHNCSNILGNMAPQLKRRKLENAVEEISFDPDARHEFLTGFHKRKVQRIKLAQEHAEKRAREEKREERRKVRSSVCTRLSTFTDIYFYCRSANNEQQKSNKLSMNPREC